MEKTPVTVLGLGRMGAALARAFVAAGHPTTVFNRTPKHVSGATTATTASEAVAASPLVVVCVRDHDASRELLAPAAAAVAGRTVADLASGTPEQARDGAAWAAEHDADFLAGAIMAVPQGIGRPDATILYDGPDAVFDAHRPTLDVLGRSVHVGARPGLAALHDLALLGIMWSTFGGYLHALALLGTAGVRAADFTPMATQWLEVVTGFLPEMGEQVDAGDYATDVSSLDINAAGLELLAEASRAQGLGDAVPEPLRALYARAVEQGRGEESVAALVEVIRG
jgi:3-hydroxyisobutyrate dehydrogenase-like beta-hydroxyacid dehydrogenase